MKRKIAYDSGSHDNVSIKSKVTDISGGNSSTEMGERGFSSNEMTSDYDATDPETYDTYSPDTSDEDQVLSNELMELFLLLGDEMDHQDELALANFADFMVVKLAQAKNLDPTRMFNQLLIKVNNTDIADTNETIKKLTKIYSRTLALEYLKNKDLEKAKESAYKKTLHRADQYLSE
jgi:hypothetical protein